ncbi:MAG: HD domain-containing phosphohydrolase [Syntrophales bacterium]|nr:HD domain-containing phosphohydrolase [Syntrophales bacterium]
MKWFRHIENISLLAKFTAISLILTVAIAVVMALGIQTYLEQSALQQEAENAAEQVATLLNPYLHLSDFEGPLPAARFAAIDVLVRERIISSRHIVRVKLWSRNGTVLYSDNPNLVGRRFPLEKELQEALDGRVAFSISSLEREENIGERGGFKRLIEIYTPVKPVDSSQIAGAYEIYHETALLDAQIEDARQKVWTRTALSFMILYGSLFLLVRGASRELILRNAENQSLFSQAQEQLEELSALYSLSRVLADAVHETEVVLNLVARRAVETLHVTFARFALLKGEGFVVSAVYPVRILDRDLEVGKIIAVSDCASCRRVLSANEPVVLHANSPDLDADERRALFLDMAKTVCLVPLHLGDRSLGLMMLAETRDERREPFTQEKLKLAQSIGEQVASALHRAELFAELERAYLQTTVTLANAVNAKDDYTADHSEQLADMAVALGRELKMSPRELQDLHYGAILHDIGKIGVPDAVLQKPGSLTSGEWEQMRRHPIIGWQILMPVPRLSGVAAMVRHHHERYDGRGYPDCLTGKAIPLGARILNIVDSYSAMTDKRVYKAARSREEAVTELKRCSGAQFDPGLVKIFLELPEELAKD